MDDRVLRVGVTAGEIESAEQQIMAIVANFSAHLKAELMDLIAEEIIQMAKDNIAEGAQSSRTPPTGRLAASLGWSINGDKLEVFAGRTGPSSEYAAIHNRPVGDATVIHAHGKYLSFFWYRWGIPVAAKQVFRPGTGFLDRAVEEATSDSHLSQLARRAVVKVESGSVFNPGTTVVGSGGSQVQRFGSMGYKGASGMGLVRRSGSGFKLTSAGQAYVNMSSSQKRKYRRKRRSG